MVIMTCFISLYAGLMLDIVAKQFWSGSILFVAVVFILHPQTEDNISPFNLASSGEIMDSAAERLM